MKWQGGFFEAWLWCSMRAEKESPHSPAWMGAALGAYIETPSSGLSLDQVASPQSPSPFGPASGAYSEVVPLGKPDCVPDREK